jgi:hypothetical protein
MNAPTMFDLYKHVTQMQTLTIAHMVVVKDYDHMITMNENLNSNFKINNEIECEF